jgi:hypothetical protein
LSKNPKGREHVRPVCLSAPHYLAISRLSGREEISQPAAILLALNEGLHCFGVIADYDYQLLNSRYRRKLIDIIASGKLKGESHKTVISLEEQRKRQEETTLAKYFKGVFEQWSIHTDLGWRIKAVAEARNHPEFEFAQKIIALES